MARKKPNVIKHVITNEDAAAEIMREISTTTLEIDRIENWMNDKINYAKEKAAIDSVGLRAELQDLLVSLEAWAKQNKEELFKNSKSVVTLFGSYGFRKTSKLAALKGFQMGDVLAAVQAAKYKAGLRVKIELNKDHLNQLPGEKLAEFKAEVKSNDVFWAEPDLTNLEGGSHDQ